tara:strand:+ start:228 stop:536 length:309 start_codon:yes stop_codon:yes gene_type:complete
MAIIKYTLVNGQVPSGLSVKGQWHNPEDGTYIGIGSGVGTELSVPELKTYVKSLKSIVNMRHVEWDADPEADASPEPTVNRPITDSEIETAIDGWCTEMGIS